MANFKRVKGIQCCDAKLTSTTFIIDDEFSAITTGSTIQVTSGETKGCYDVTEVVDAVGPATATLDSIHSTCEECLSGITTAVQVSKCDSEPLETYFVDITSFTTLPEIGSVVYLELEKVVPACFTIDCYVVLKPGTTIYTLTSMGGSYTGCTECILNSFTTYQVDTCDGTNTYYIGFPPGFDYTNYLVTFDIGFGEILCGIVKGLSNETTTATLISVLGTTEEVSCEECLSASTEKRIITNCLTQEEQVVYGSVFYEGNEVSNLSTNDGCFEVGDLTESAVTINTFLNFDPQPDCQECIQCNGLYYTYLSCTNSGPISNYSNTLPNSTFGDGTYGPFTGTTDGNGIGATFSFVIASGLVNSIILYDSGIKYSAGDTITIDKVLFGGSDDLVITITDVLIIGTVFSFQYVQDPIGKTFYIPQLDDCVEITAVSNSADGYNYDVYSFDVFESCSLCQANDYYVWLTSECGSGQNNIVVLNSNTYIAGDYVKNLRGTTEFQCQELLSPYTYSDGNFTSYISNTLTPFEDCTTCNSGTLIGASIVKCGGGGQQFVNIPINTWNQMANFDSQSIFVLETYGQCYGLLNTCPLEPNFTTIYPIETYYNCIECSDDNTRFPRSANTESHICVVCCPCGGTGSTINQVSPPHPVWTDAYGTPVTQMNMITLGGPNGLNN